MSAKPEVEILIIDNERRRDDTYRAFFQKLTEHTDSLYRISPLIPERPSQANEHLQSRRPCLVVLDVVLEGEWAEYAQMLYQSIRRGGYPVALLSGSFNDAAMDKTSRSVLAELRSIPKLGFLPWVASIYSYCFDAVGSIKNDPLPNHVPTVWNYMLLEAVQDGRHWRPSKEGEVTFLHLTDTHFGPVKNDYLEAVSMKAGIAKTGSQADYVLWTGDITERGLPSEFRMAYLFAEELIGAEFIDKSTPFSVVPGNHDICWPLALASRLRQIDSPTTLIDPCSAPGTVTSVTDKKGKFWQVEDSSVTEELTRFGRSPFQEFFTQLTGESYPEDDYRFLAHWAHRGFVILELPLEAHVLYTRSDQEKPPPLIPEDRFIAITNKVISSVKSAKLHKSICVIAIIHGRDPDGATKNISRWKQLIAEIGKLGHPIVVLGGHEHTNDHAPEKNRLMIVGAPLSERKTEGGLTLPGVGLIRLSGLGTRELKCDVTKLEKSNGDGSTTEWNPKTTRRFETLKKSGHWTEDTTAPDNQP